jgi:hypothetical protein
MNNNTQETRSIEELVRMIDQKKLVLPEFQRDFKWPIEKSETLFDSLFQDLFIGSLIISRPKFELACKGFDLRERGKSQHKPKPELYTVEDFEHKDIYTLLDGQQRATSIYRALKGFDVIYVILKDIDTLKRPDYFDPTTEDVLVNFEEYIEGFDTTKPKDNEFYLRICDLFTSINYSEKRFFIEFVNPQLDELPISLEEKEIYRCFAGHLLINFRSDIIKKSNLLSVQLLNMNLEKFCLYFERSNSQGLNLSFTDIITAKVYIDFKLSSKISEAKSRKTYINDALIDPIVRYINYKANGEVTKKSILSDLRGQHFIEHWDDVINDIDYIQSWLEENNWVFNVSNLPYRTMLLPILSFFQNLRNKEFSQATQDQLDVLKYWFYASIVDNRYGGARHGSTNVVLKKDCDILCDLAKGNFPDAIYWQNLRIEYSYDEFLKIDNKSNAKFMGLNYLMWSKHQFKNFENNGVVSFSSNVDVHHIIPSDYIEKKYGENSPEYDFSDSVLNKVRINKISNIKIGAKAPSVYLAEIKKSFNSKIEDSLATHGIHDADKLINGDFDGDFIGFLKLRYKCIEPYMSDLKYASNKLCEGENSNIWLGSD